MSQMLSFLSKKVNLVFSIVQSYTFWTLLPICLNHYPAPRYARNEIQALGGGAHSGLSDQLHICLSLPSHLTSSLRVPGASRVFLIVPLEPF